MVAQYATSGGVIEFQDFHTGYSEEMGVGRFQIIRPCILAWRDRHSFVRDMVGYSFIGKNPANQNSSIQRFIPDRHPHAGNLANGLSDNVYAVSCRLVDSLGTMDETGAFNSLDYGAGGQAIVDVVYEPLPYRVLADENTANEFNRFTTKKVQHTMDVLQIPGGMIVGGTSNAKVAEATPYRVRGAEITYVWHDIPTDDQTRQLPQTLQDNITNGIGKVNNAAFDIYNAETLLAMPPQYIPGFNAAGVPNFNIVYRFLWREKTWNFIFNPNINQADPDNKWEAATFVQGGGDLFNTYDFNKFWQTA